MKNDRLKKGFTLIEILFLIAIALIIAGSYIFHVTKTNKSGTNTNTYMENEYNKAISED
jgi:Tfp pilus assembly protein PilE